MRICNEHYIDRDEVYKWKWSREYWDRVCLCVQKWKMKNEKKKFVETRGKWHLCTHTTLTLKILWVWTDSNDEEDDENTGVTPMRRSNRNIFCSSPVLSSTNNDVYWTDIVWMCQCWRCSWFFFVHFWRRRRCHLLPIAEAKNEKEISGDYINYMGFRNCLCVLGLMYCRRIYKMCTCVCWVRPKIENRKTTQNIYIVIVVEYRVWYLFLCVVTSSRQQRLQSK